MKCPDCRQSGRHAPDCAVHTQQDYQRLIGEMLRQARLVAGITQVALAEKMGAAQSDVSRIENGGFNYPLKTLADFAKACGHKLTFNVSKGGRP